MEIFDRGRSKLPEGILIKMLAVRPVVDFDTAKGLCEFVGVPYSPENFTYFAADVNDDGTKLNFVIGICTFNMRGGICQIEYLKSAPEVEDDEALMIMARAVTNFMYRCEAKNVTLSDEGVSESLGRRLGFVRKDGKRQLDLEKFYNAPCKHNI